MTREELLALIDQAADEGWTELDLSGQGLTELPAEIGKLTQLETLILGKVNGWKVEDNKLSPIPITNALADLPKELKTLKNLQTLNLSGNPLTNVPAILLEMPRLQSLALASVGLLDASNLIVQLTNLKELDLSGNQISEIPDSIVQLTNLKELDLSGNQISEIPDSIIQLTNLKELDLSGNQISEIPDSIVQLTNLTGLYLSRNQISEIPHSIAQLTNLTGLHLSNNQISEIPHSIVQLTNLKELYFRHNQISEIPDSIVQLTNLTGLNLSRNQISEIPHSIAQLTNLKWLDLSRNQISETPDSIIQLINLTRLDLSENQISEIPHSIVQLTNLKELYLRHNQISEIPDSIVQLTNLTGLYLSRNQISEIPDSIAQLTNLTTLYLSRNQISEIPDSIAQLTNLTTLYLFDNQISEIPDSIAQLTNLTMLALFDNQISEIPDSIAQLTNLTTLYLSDNQISEIPDSIAQLTHLETLDLTNNQITVCPEWLENLPELQELDLRGNPLPISPEVLEDCGSVEGIFNYCRQLRSGEVRPLNEAKLLLVGQGSVGKTSLIKRLIHDRFNPQEAQTDGLCISTWNIHVNSKDVRLNVWDFGGQEIYHATHQFFLTKRSLYLLVCNCRTSEDENRIEYWLKLIESFGDKSPVIIVGNKSDEQPLDINRKALRSKYPNIKAIIETSCQTNEGIDTLRNAIIQEVGHLSDVYNLLPLSWFEVKEQLEAIDQDFITYTKYACICESKTITEEHNQEQLIDLLHNLGLVLSFRNHPILQNTNVLNPDWVTQGIYTLLSDDRLKTETKGILSPDDLTRILDAQRYPANRHHYLTELMKEFQLCFPLAPSTSQVLIPGLLPKEEPEATDLAGDTLEFQYHYRILPESIISRFIVLTHDKIYNHTYWRSGVMLSYAEQNETYNIARIKADPEDKKIFIAINGRESTRRSFLLIIRDVFNKIHNSFGNLEVSEWVPVPGYPDHPPLDYQELLGLEAMGEREYPIGKLRIKVNLRQLLDGYEPVELRHRRQMGDRAFELEYGEDSPYNIHLTFNNHHSRIHQHGKGDNVAGDRVQGDKIIGQ